MTPTIASIRGRHAGVRLARARRKAVLDRVAFCLDSCMKKLALGDGQIDLMRDPVEVGMLHESLRAIHALAKDEGYVDQPRPAKDR